MTMNSEARHGLDTGSGPADLALVKRALRGESEAVEGVLVRMSCVVRFVFRLNRKLGYRLPSEALEDVVQQVYLSVWPRLDQYVGTASIESWVFGFCRNCLRAEARRRGHRLRLVRPMTAGDDGGGEAPEPASDEAEPEQEFARVEGIEALRDELDRLSPDERVVVELRHLEDWSFERIAEQLELPASTVKDRCYRALTKMKGRLRRRDVSA